MAREDLILVTGAGGFIGGHLVKALRNIGSYRIRAVDIKDPSQNIHWVVPEGGGGPNYPAM